MSCTLDVEINLIGGDDVNIVVSTDLCETQLSVESTEQNLTLEISDAPVGDASISKVSDNRLEHKPDGLYVPPTSWTLKEW